MPMPYCDVCGRLAAGVASSAFGAVSWAFCQECMLKPAEPLPAFQYLYDDVSDHGEDVRNEVNLFFTWIDGRYVSWPDYVDMRQGAEMKVGDTVRAKDGRDCPSAIQNKDVPVVRTDELSVWVERDGRTYVLDRSQLRLVKRS